jgi:hypothetical protein
MPEYKEMPCRLCKKVERMPESRSKRSGANICRECLSLRQKEWASKNKHKVKITCNRFQRKLRREILEHYSNSSPAKCNKCGELRYGCLELDHIKNDGAKHQKRLYEKIHGENNSDRQYMAYRGMSASIYRDIKNNGYPKGYQILCANCHRMKTRGEFYGSEEYFEGKNSFDHKFDIKEKRLCSINECDKPHEAKGYCQNHYQLLRRNGDPLKKTISNTRFKSGQKPHNIKFTDDQIIIIRKRLSSGETGRSIAREFKVDKSTIYDIRDNRTWRDVNASKA